MKNVVVKISKGTYRGQEVSGKEFTALSPVLKGKKGYFIYVDGKAVGFDSKIRVRVPNVQSVVPTEGELPEAGEVETVKVERETDEQIMDRINERMNAMEKMAIGTAAGAFRSLIVSGAPGVGKSYLVERNMEKLAEAGEIRYEQVKGGISAVGLYALLYQMRGSNDVVVMDDCDSVFNDENSLNILKTALDTTDRRVISWRKQIRMESEDGDEIPTKFEYEGSIIFITNMDFQKLAEKDRKMSPHYAALIDRSLYIDLTIRSNRDRLLRIKHVVGQGMLDKDLGKQLQKEILEFVEENISTLQDMSLRVVKKIAGLAKVDPKNWRRLAQVTCMKKA